MKDKTTQKMQTKLRKIGILAFHFRIQICKVVAVLSAIYVMLSLFELRVLLGFSVFVTSIFGLGYFKWRNLKEKGIINTLKPGVKDLLLKRSLYDLYRDQVYYPYFTKIIGVFIRGAISKPHPEQLDKMLEEQLPENVKRAIYTKGILHLAPEKVQKMILEKEECLIPELEAPPVAKPKPQTLVPKSYGTVNQMWDRRTQYEGEEVKIHEVTISKEILNKLNEKIKWGHIVGFTALLSFVVMKTKGKKLGKILLYNGSVMGILMLAALLVIKYKNPIKQSLRKIQMKPE